jgi:CDP-diacylglycerol pyrophosphatase
MTPAEAIARGRVIAGGEREPIDAAIKILQRISEDNAISLQMSPEALRGAAHHHAKIVQCLSFMADSLDAELSPARKRWQRFAGRVAEYLGHRSTNDVIIALSCASMGAAEFTNGRTGWAALLAAVAALNLFCAWLSYRRAKGSA